MIIEKKVLLKKYSPRRTIDKEYRICCKDLNRALKQKRKAGEDRIQVDLEKFLFDQNKTRIKNELEAKGYVVMPLGHYWNIYFEQE